MVVGCSGTFAQCPICTRVVEARELRGICPACVERVLAIERKPEFSAKLRELEIRDRLAAAARAEAFLARMRETFGREEMELCNI